MSDDGGVAVQKKGRGRSGKADKNENAVKEVKKRGKPAAAVGKKDVELEVEDGVAPVKKGRGGQTKVKAGNKTIVKAAPGGRRGRSKKDEKKGTEGDEEK